MVPLLESLRTVLRDEDTVTGGQTLFSSRLAMVVGFTAMEEEWSSREIGVKLSKHLKLGTDSGWQDEKESVGRWWEVAEPCECTQCCAAYPATGLGGSSDGCVWSPF